MIFYSFLNCIVVSDHFLMGNGLNCSALLHLHHFLFDWYFLDVLSILIFYNFLFIGNIVDSTLAFILSNIPLTRSYFLICDATNRPEFDLARLVLLIV